MKEYKVDDAEARFPVENAAFDLGHGDVVIAAITSCTNTSNPSVMMGAGLLARKAVAKGLKTSRGSRRRSCPAARWSAST